jgi:hypothetical protein
MYRPGTRFGSNRKIRAANARSPEGAVQGAPRREELDVPQSTRGMPRQPSEAVALGTNSTGHTRPKGESMKTVSSRIRLAFVCILLRHDGNERGARDVRSPALRLAKEPTS